MKKMYSINLDEEIVKKALKRIENFGGKLSTLINKLLQDFAK
jgi:hypothetical protein